MHIFKFKKNQHCNIMYLCCHTKWN